MPRRTQSRWTLCAIPNPHFKVRRMELEKLYIWSNPDFKEVIIFYGLEAISFRDRRKSKILFDTVRTRLLEIDCTNWPYNDEVVFVLRISGPTKMYSRRDVDNMAKVVLDAGNKIIYSDDRLVNILIVEKTLWDIPLYGFSIGVRRIEKGVRDKYSPDLYLHSEVDTHIDDSKVVFLKIFHIENEVDREYVRLNSDKSKAEGT